MRAGKPVLVEMHLHACDRLIRDYALPDTASGASLRRIAVSAPLPSLQGGVLRVWWSTSVLGYDWLRVSLQDAVTANRSDFSSRVQRVSQQGVQPVYSSFCASVEKAVCGDLTDAFSNPDLNPIPGGGLIALLLFVAALLAGLSWAISWYMDQFRAGDMQKYEEQAPPEKEEMLEGDWILVQREPQRPYWYHYATEETTWQWSHAQDDEHKVSRRALEDQMEQHRRDSIAAAEDKAARAARAASTKEAYQKRTPTIQVSAWPFARAKRPAPTTQHRLTRARCSLHVAQELRLKASQQSQRRLVLEANDGPLAAELPAENPGEGENEAVGDTPIMRKLIAQAKAATLMKTYGEAIALEEDHYEETGATRVGGHLLPVGDVYPQEPYPGDPYAPAPVLQVMPLDTAPWRSFSCTFAWPLAFRPRARPTRPTHFECAISRRCPGRQGRSRRCRGGGMPALQGMDNSTVTGLLVHQSKWMQVKAAPWSDPTRAVD